MGRKSSYENGLVYGVGLNDISPVSVNGKMMSSYIAWYGMIQRCYNPPNESVTRQYKDCTVSKDWLIFSNYKKWYDLHCFNSCQVDKDLLNLGNEVYSRDSCIMVTGRVNAFFAVRDSKKGMLSGVSPTGKKYRAALPRVNGKAKASKSVPTQEEAHELYCEGRQKRAMELIENLHHNQQHRDKVIHSLLNFVDRRFGPEGNRFYVYGT